jgi:hypothetical protein
MVTLFVVVLVPSMLMVALPELDSMRREPPVPLARVRTAPLLVKVMLPAVVAAFRFTVMPPAGRLAEAPTPFGTLPVDQLPAVFQDWVPLVGVKFCALTEDAKLNPARHSKNKQVLILGIMSGGGAPPHEWCPVMASLLEQRHLCHCLSCHTSVPAVVSWVTLFAGARSVRKRERYPTCWELRSLA